MIFSDMQVRYFGATCKTCRCDFQIPLLSDFSYGEFICHGRTVAGYFNSFEGPVWDDINSRLTTLGLLPGKPDSEQIAHMQEVIANTADPLGGQRLHMHPLCPHCGSIDVSFGDTRPGEFH